MYALAGAYRVHTASPPRAFPESQWPFEGTQPARQAASSPHRKLKSLLSFFFFWYTLGQGRQDPTSLAYNDAGI